VRLLECMYVYMYVCMYVCMCLAGQARLLESMYVCVYVCMQRYATEGRAAEESEGIDTTC
jgi:hypothetical protein